MASFTGRNLDLHPGQFQMLIFQKLAVFLGPIELVKRSSKRSTMAIIRGVQTAIYAVSL